jgi:subtilase family serine protease
MVPRAALVIATALVLVAIPSPVLAAPAGHPAPSSPASPRLITDAVPVPPDSSVAPLAPGTVLRLVFTLPFSNASGLSSFLAAVGDPGSNAYRQFLSYAGFERKFAPSGSSAADVEQTLRSSGASSVTVAPGGLAVDATMAARAVERLLGAPLVRFADSMHGSSYTVEGSPTLPPDLLGKVSGIDGLASATGPILGPTLDELSAPAPVRAGPTQYVQGNGAGAADWFLGSDYAQAYGATELLPGNRSVPGATYPQGVAIATLLASGYSSSSGMALPPWSPSVIDDYFNDTFPASWPLPTITGVPVYESGAPLPPLPGSFHGENDSTGFELENSLDLEMAGSLAPGSSLYNFYFSGALTEGPATWSNVAAYLADDLAASLSYNYSPSHLAVVSCSCGLGDLNNSHWDAELEVAAATGVTVVASSGDQGNAPAVLTGRDEDAWPLWPATAAFNTSGAVSVGGVTIALSGIPTGTYTSPPLVLSYDSSVEGIANVSAWWDTSGGVGNYAGTEGGTSLTYAEPWWQFHSAAQPAIVNATEDEGFGRLGRAGPDVAFPANSTIAFVSAGPSGTPNFAVVAGTSVAAPVLAGLLADVVVVENATLGSVTGLGFLDPELYRIASYYQANPGSTDPILDVVYGSNALFSAGPGWDATTGWGGLSAPLFLAADENATVADYAYAGPTPTLPPPSSSSTSSLAVVIVLAGAAAAIVAASVVLASRARRRAPTYLPVRLYGWPANPPPLVPPPAGPFATFSCPYCGFARPAEPGHCPSCGAM